MMDFRKELLALKSRRKYPHAFSGIERKVEKMFLDLLDSLGTEEFTSVSKVHVGLANNLDSYKHVGKENNFYKFYPIYSAAYEEIPTSIQLYISDPNTFNYFFLKATGDRIGVVQENSENFYFPV